MASATNKEEGGSGSGSGLRSAPARSVRRLPALPSGPPLPTAPLPNAGAGAGRRVRPLPSVPGTLVSVKESGHVRSQSVRKPLPVPVPVVRPKEEEEEAQEVVVIKQEERDSWTPELEEDEEDEEELEDLEEGVVQLGNRIVLGRISSSVEGEEEKEEEKDEYVDYGWVLADRMMGQGVVSKWMLERKGKRYTERDYENIIQALRSL
ncbi:hypothetical protein JR316_0013278 [Psilocybe cubensis]|nr:hypothetical protein JR316_0013278 [Psilocybe cubensis]KAH9474813.1 hypothetical protein JR316_0013278 [Psilocybe cubensis]